MNAKVKQLAQARQDLQQAKEAMTFLLDTLQATPSWKKVQDQVAASSEAVKTLEMQLRDEAVAGYFSNGELHPHSAVNIQMKRVVVLNEDEALVMDYCLHALKPALMIDRKALERFIKAGGIPNNIGEVINQPSATIKTDLSEYL